MEIGASLNDVQHSPVFNLRPAVSESERLKFEQGLGGLGWQEIRASLEGGRGNQQQLSKSFTRNKLSAFGVTWFDATKVSPESV